MKWPAGTILTDLYRIKPYNTDYLYTVVLEDRLIHHYENHCIPSQKNYPAQEFEVYSEAFSK